MKPNLKENFEELIMQKIDEMIRQLNTVDLANLKNSLGLIEAVDKLYDKASQLKSYLAGGLVQSAETGLEQVPEASGAVEIIDYNSLSNNVHPGLVKALEEDRKKSLKLEEDKQLIYLNSDNPESQFAEIEQALNKNINFRGRSNILDHKSKFIKSLKNFKSQYGDLKGTTIEVFCQDAGGKNCILNYHKTQIKS